MRIKIKTLSEIKFLTSNQRSVIYDFFNAALESTFQTDFSSIYIGLASSDVSNTYLIAMKVISLAYK